MLDRVLINETFTPKKDISSTESAILRATYFQNPKMPMACY